MKSQKESPDSGGRVQALATLVGDFVSWSASRFLIESPVYPPLLPFTAFRKMRVEARRKRLGAANKKKP